MPRDHGRKNRRVDYPQVGHTPHSERRIDDATVFERRHTCRAGRMVKSFRLLANQCLELFVRISVQIVMQFGMRVAYGIYNGSQSFGVGNRVEEAQTTNQCLDVVGIGEVTGAGPTSA